MGVEQKIVVATVALLFTVVVIGLLAWWWRYDERRTEREVEDYKQRIRKHIDNMRR